MGRGGFWPEDDGTEKEFGGWEGREVADKCWGRGEEGGQDPSAAWLALQGGWLCAAGSWPAEKGSAAEENSGEGGHCSRAQLGAGSGPITRLGGHCHTRWDAEWGDYQGTRQCSPSIPQIPSDRGTHAHRLLPKGEPTTSNKWLFFTSSGTPGLLKRC